ncbi:hypothetical protein SDC9_152277 [bioreactor metagenome]|uniref:Uncharacterized protein n=1 Tax=bioreactor metagenome TaxID=1076179 RepID=A0A645ESN3_9ZZZZ
MPALHKLDGGLALANAGLAQEQYPLAVDLHKHSVAGDPGRKVGFEVADERAHERRSGVRRAENGAVVFFGRFQALGENVKAAGDDERRDFLGEKPVKAEPPLVGCHPGKIGGLDPADDLEAFGVKIVKKASQLQCRTVYILGVDEAALIIGAAAHDLQLKILHQLTELHMKPALHLPSPRLP